MSTRVKFPVVWQVQVCSLDCTTPQAANIRLTLGEDIHSLRQTRSHQASPAPTAGSSQLVLYTTPEHLQALTAPSAIAPYSPAHAHIFPDQLSCLSWKKSFARST